MGRSAAIRVLFAAIAVVFFATPIAARTLGVTAEQFENRRFASAPKPGQGWEAFQQTSRYLIDRMPLRAQAVRTNTRIWTEVFDTDPPYTRDRALANDQALPFAGAVEDEGDLRIDGENARGGPAAVKAGHSGWLFTPVEFTLACQKPALDVQQLRAWAKLVRVAGEDGRDAAMFVPPSKGSVYPEYLPDSYPSDHCAPAGKERFWRLLAEQGPDLGVHELRSELVRRKANAGAGLYQRTDTHWSTLGALTFVDAALEAVGDGVRLEPNEIVAKGSAVYTGDLSVVGGNAKEDTRDEYGIERAPDAPRVPGKTLILCDSFGYRWFRLFKPYFEDVRYLSWYAPTPKMVKAIQQSDRVIIEAEEITFKQQLAQPYAVPPELAADGS